MRLKTNCNINKETKIIRFMINKLFKIQKSKIEMLILLLISKILIICNRP